MNLALANQAELDEVQRELERIRNEQQQINSRIAAERSKQDDANAELRVVAAERDLIQNEIDEKELRLDELELQIQILEDSITETEESIAETSLEVDRLDRESQEQLSNMYFGIKSNNSTFNAIFADGNASFVKAGLYQQVLQSDTNSALQQLEQKKAQLEQEKTKLEQDRIQIDEDRASVQEERDALDEKRAELQSKVDQFVALFNQAQRNINANLNAFDLLSEEEQALQQRLDQLYNSISNSVGSVSSGQFVTAGTAIGVEGNTGVSTGAHLDFRVWINNSIQNPCTALPSRTLANTSCGTSSPKVPNWPMSGNPYLTSGYGPRAGGFHLGIDLSTGGGAPIYAAHDGWITYGNDGACSWYTGIYPCNGAGGNYAIICENRDNCAAGLKTMYLHLR